jgi:4-hydroxybenzoyl-CoA thioesterase
VAHEAARYIAVRIRVRWGECDPAGIAFYPRFFEWMDTAAHTLRRELGISREDMLPPASLGLPLVSARAEFLASAFMEDNLEIRSWVTRVGRTSLGLHHEIVRVGEDGEQLLARGREERVLVSRDATGAMRPRELTPEMRAVLARYLESVARDAETGRRGDGDPRRGDGESRGPGERLTG